MLLPPPSTLALIIEATDGCTWFAIGKEMPEYLEVVMVATDIQKGNPTNVRPVRWLGDRWGGIKTLEHPSRGHCYFWRRLTVSEEYLKV